MSDRLEGAEFPALNVAIDADLWVRVKAGDQASIEECRRIIDGLVLYEHILCMTAGDEFVGLHKLYEFGVIRAVRLYSEIPAG